MKSIVALSLCAFFVAQSTQAQTGDQLPRPRIEVDAGGGLLGGAALGSGDANLRANSTTPQAFRLFSAESLVARTSSFHARGAVALNRRWGIEGGVVVGHPEVRTSLSGDVEGAPPLTVVERIDQYFFEAGIVVMLEQWRMGRRTMPFAAAGAGYLRQLHEGLTVIEHGHLYHAGGGLKHWLLARNGGRIRAAGLRTDVRLYLLSRGVSLDDGPRPHLAISGSAFVGF
jgi:hypothetical protein